MNCRLTTSVLGGVVAVWAVVAACIPAAPAADRCEGLIWRELHFEARKFLMKATATVRVRPVSPSELAASVRPLPSGKEAITPGGSGVEVTTESTLPFGRSEVTTTWIDTETGAVLQAEKLVSGRKNYQKILRYGTLGYNQWRISPASKGEAKLPQSAWTRRSEKFVEFRPRRGSEMIVSDPFSLIYRIATSHLDRAGTSLPIIVNAKGDLVELNFTAGETTQRSFTWIDRSPGGENTDRRTSKVRKVVATARSLAGGGSSGDVDTGFMGIRGNLTVLVLEGDGTPVEIRGRSKNFGEIVVKLKRRVMSD